MTMRQSVSMRSRSAGSKSSYRMKTRGPAPTVVPDPYYESTTITSPVIPPAYFLDSLPGTPMSPPMGFPAYEEETVTHYPATPLLRSGSMGSMLGGGNGNTKWSMKQTVRSSGGSSFRSGSRSRSQYPGTSRYNYSYRERTGSRLGRGPRSSLRIKERGTVPNTPSFTMGSYFTGNGLPFTYSAPTSGLPSRLMAPIPTKSSSMSFRAATPPITLPPRVPYYEEETVTHTPLRMAPAAPFYEEEVITQTRPAPSAVMAAAYRSRSPPPVPAPRRQYFEESIDVEEYSAPLPPSFSYTTRQTAPTPPPPAPTSYRQQPISQPMYYEEEIIQQPAQQNITFTSQQQYAQPRQQTQYTQSVAQPSVQQAVTYSTQYPQQQQQQSVVYTNQQQNPLQPQQPQQLQQSVTYTTQYPAQQQQQQQQQSSVIYAARQPPQQPSSYSTTTTKTAYSNGNAQSAYGQPQRTTYEEEVIEEDYTPAYNNYRSQYSYGG